MLVSIDVEAPRRTCEICEAALLSDTVLPVHDAERLPQPRMYHTTSRLSQPYGRDKALPELRPAQELLISLGTSAAYQIPRCLVQSSLL
jgi:hypothetical protein